MKPAAEIERLIGYRAGRLRDGWWLMFLTELPTIDQFEYRGHSHMSGGRIQGHLPQNANSPTAEQRLENEGMNLTGTSYQKKGMKQKTIEDQFTLAGSKRLAKVRPVADAARDPLIPDYPPGTGIPQWTLVVPLRWKAAAFIAPGTMYQGNYD